MRRLFCTVLVAVAMVTAFAAPADADPAEDSVVGTGVISVNFAGVVDILLRVTIDAHSDSSGGNPTGSVLVAFDAGGLTVFSGPVTCLAVEGNTAYVGIADEVTPGPIIFEVVDNSATGSADTIGVIDEDILGCDPGFSPVANPLVSGDFVVHASVALTSKDQCKLGGWSDLTNDEGQPFASQGECVAFVQRRSGLAA